jgi:hypothetical protein
MIFVCLFSIAGHVQLDFLVEYNLTYMPTGLINKPELAALVNISWAGKAKIPQTAPALSFPCYFPQSTPSS